MTIASVTVIVFYLMEGINKSILTKLEVKGRKLLMIYNQDDDDNFLINSLDKYLKMGLELELQEQIKTEQKSYKG